MKCRLPHPHASKRPTSGDRMGPSPTARTRGRRVRGSGRTPRSGAPSTRRVPLVRWSDASSRSDRHRCGIRQRGHRRVVRRSRRGHRRGEVVRRDLPERRMHSEQDAGLHRPCGPDRARRRHLRRGRAAARRALAGGSRPGVRATGRATRAGPAGPPRRGQRHGVRGHGPLHRSPPTAHRRGRRRRGRLRRADRRRGRQPSRGAARGGRVRGAVRDVGHRHADRRTASPTGRAGRRVHRRRARRGLPRDGNRDHRRGDRAAPAGPAGRDGRRAFHRPGPHPLRPAARARTHGREGGGGAR